MKYTEELKNKGFEFKIRKECINSEGYDLYLKISKGDSYSESFYSMSHSKGYYFTSDYTDCHCKNSLSEKNNVKLFFKNNPPHNKSGD